MSSNIEFKVNTPGLNLRSEPRVKSNNIIASLSLGDTVTKLGAAADPKWWRVSTIIQGNHVERMTRTYTGGTAANWVVFLEQVDS